MDASPDSSDASCGDTMSSKINCGRCGHDCCGGDCVNGKCQPVPVYEGPDGGNEAPEELAVYSGYVYFSSTTLDGVMRVQIGTGRREPVWDTKLRVTSLAGDGSGVYGAAVGGDAGDKGPVQRFLLSGPPQVLLADEDHPSEIALDESYVYWRSGSSVIKRWPKAGGTIAPVGAAITNLGPFTAFKASVYYNQTSGGRILQRVAQGDTELASSEVSVASIAANQTYVFWTQATPQKIRRVAMDTHSPIDLADARGTPTVVAADDTYVYWLTFGPAGALRANRVDVSNTTVDLATNLASPRKFALDAKCVYVTTGGAPGRILRIAKP